MTDSDYWPPTVAALAELIDADRGVLVLRLMSPKDRCQLGTVHLVESRPLVLLRRSDLLAASETRTTRVRTRAGVLLDEPWPTHPTAGCDHHHDIPVDLGGVRALFDLTCRVRTSKGRYRIGAPHPLPMSTHGLL